MIKGKKKKALRRKSLIFRDVQFYEDPCKETIVLYALMGGGEGKDGPFKPVMIVGPAGLIRQIKTKLRKP